MDNNDDMTIEEIIVLRALFSQKMHNSIMQKDKQSIIAEMNNNTSCLANMNMFKLTCVDFDAEKVYNDYHTAIKSDLSWVN